MSWVIYKHTLIADCPHYGWSYIGQTRKKPAGRWGANGSGYFKYTQTDQLAVFAKAIKKYGWESFSHEILEDGLNTVEEANLREQYWIAFYHTYVNDPECAGYNMTRGGGGSLGFKHSDETRAYIKQKLHEAFPNGRFGENHPMYGKHLSDTVRQKISDKKRANPTRYWAGKARSKSTKEKLRQANLGKRLTDEQKALYAQKKAATKIKNSTDKLSWVKIYQFSLNDTFIKEWPKLTDAAEAFKIPPGNITKVCQGIRRSAGGFKWQYANKSN